MGNIDSGRPSGFTHSSETRNKISVTMTGVPKPSEHHAKITRSNRERDLAIRCMERLEDLRNSYPTEALFFDEYEPELLLAMQDVRTEKELMDIRLYVEVAPLRPGLPYSQASSSYFAAEDVMIALLDFKIHIERTLLDTRTF